VESQLLLNPAELLLLALDSENLDARVTEVLAWVPFHSPEMNWKRLTPESKSPDRQNGLAYVALPAIDVVQKRGETQLAEKLSVRVTRLERFRLAGEEHTRQGFHVAG